MPNAASDWQLRLQKHFEGLSITGENAQRPIFAIEHGLNSGEVEELQSIARAELVLHGLLSEHWLIWVVYATEYGYCYDGFQFWEDFSDQTPSWHQKGNRNKIRDWFQRFQSTFGGIEPRGRWATHFSIISWPITHAILPRDLQRRLARAIYEAQYDLRSVVGRSTLEVGWVLADSVYEESPRFMLFLEQKILVGEIVVSLLGNMDKTTATIESTALERISKDLSAMHDARDWIRQAQQTWRSHTPRFKIEGTIGRTSSSSQLSHKDNLLLSQTSALTPSIEAQQVSANNWRFELTVPAFNDVAAINSEFRDFLRGTRVSLAMAETPWLPGEWLLVGVRKRILKFWPTKGEGLLQFETLPPFDGLLNWNLALPHDNKLWVFKIQSDGIGRLLRINQLKPGHSYLLVAPIDFALGVLGPLSCSECQGISICRIEIPEIIPVHLKALLESMGLSCTQSITLSAIGIPPLRWDEESGGEWLSTTHPMLSIKRDHNFDGYQFYLEDQNMVEVLANSNAPTFIELPFLSPGKHILSIRTFKIVREQAAINKEFQAKLNFQISIRNPKPWVSGEANYPGMFVTFTPLNPSIEDLLMGRIGLEVIGENEVSSKIEIVLKDSSGNEMFRALILEHCLPISYEAWERSYHLFLNKHTSDDDYHQCNTAYLDISSREFGSYRINLERNFASLRWLLKYRDDIPSMRLIGYGSNESIQASFSDFSAPFTDNWFTQEELQHGFINARSGGLFRAKVGETSAEAIYAPIDIKGGLTALHVPFNEGFLENINNYNLLLERASIWCQAKPLTYLARIWQKQLAKILFDKVIGQYCGRRWIKAERALHERSQDDVCWESLESIVQDNQSYGIAVGKAKLNQKPSLNDIKLCLYTITRRHHIAIDDPTFELAWKLSWFDYLHEPLDEGELNTVIGYGLVIRAARLMRLRFQYDRWNLQTAIKND